MAIVRLVSGDALVHRVLRQEGQILIWVAALNQPLDLEVRHENLIALLGKVLLHLPIALEALGLVVRIRLPDHPGNALDYILSFESENENDILNSHEGMTQLGLGHLGC